MFSKFFAIFLSILFLGIIKDIFSKTINRIIPLRIINNNTVVITEYGLGFFRKKV